MKRIAVIFWGMIAALIFFSVMKDETPFYVPAKWPKPYYDFSQNPLSKEKFEETWEMLHRMIEILDMGTSKDDLSYEEVFMNKEVILNSSH